MQLEKGGIRITLVRRPNLLKYSELLYKYGNLPKNFTVHNPLWRIGLYVRISKDDGNSVSLSIVNQIKSHARALKEMDDFVVYDIYIDDGLTGTSFDRKGYNRMHEDVVNRIINCIIVIDLTRYARNLADGIKELDAYVLEHKIRFISVGIPAIDTLKDPTAISSPEVYQALSAAEDFARTTSKKVREIKSIKREDGEKNGGFPPYGYLPNAGGKHWIYDPVAGDVVRKMYLWSSEGLSDISITKKLNALGIPNPTKYKQLIGLKYQNPNSKRNSGLWWPATVKKILEDQTNIGCSVQGKSSSFDHKRHKQIAKKKEEYVVVPDCHEKIIDDDLFYQVQEIRSRRSRVTRTGKVHIFSNLVYCSGCGIAMKKTSAKGIHYLCCRSYQYAGKAHCASKRTINMKKLEDIALKAIQLQISLVENLQEVIMQAGRSLDIPRQFEKIDQLLDDKNKTFKDTEYLLDMSYFDWKNGDITKEQYLRVKERIENELGQLRTSIHALSAQRKRIAQNIYGKDDPFSRFMEHRNIEALDRTLLVEFIRRIDVNEDQSIKIDFNFCNPYLRIVDLG